jgi:hypothetical protein
MELCSCPSNVPFRDSNIKKQGHQPVENRETLTVSRETLTVRLRDVDTALLLEEVCSPHFSATKTALILEGIQTLTVRLRDVDTALLLEEVCSPHFSATKTALILEGIQRQLSRAVVRQRKNL